MATKAQAYKMHKGHKGSSTQSAVTATKAQAHKVHKKPQRLKHTKCINSFIKLGAYVHSFFAVLCSYKLWALRSWKFSTPLFSSHVISCFLTSSTLISSHLLSFLFTRLIFCEPLRLFMDFVCLSLCGRYCTLCAWAFWGRGGGGGQKRVPGGSKRSVGGVKKKCGGIKKKTAGGVKMK